MTLLTKLNEQINNLASEFYAQYKIKLLGITLFEDCQTNRVNYIYIGM
jgi:hypothetical protein